MLELLDHYTRAYLDAQLSVIYECSHSIQRDRQRALQKVNRDRASVGLEPVNLDDFGVLAR